MAVKNSDVSAKAPGFAALDKSKPDYPQKARDKFGGRRWIEAEPAILDYENTQVLLVGARKKTVQEEIGIDLD